MSAAREAGTETDPCGEAEVVARSLTRLRGLPEDLGLLGDALLEQGDLEGAAAAYQQMMNLRPGPAVYPRSAWVRRLRGDLEGAIAMLWQADRALGAADPSDAGLDPRAARVLLHPATQRASLARTLSLRSDGEDGRKGIRTHAREEE